MVEVFKTNVECDAEAEEVVLMLKGRLPGCRINIDMHDCDRVLRVEGHPICPDEIIQWVGAKGFNCIPLD